MASPHDQVERFADGELPPAEAEAFRDHLLDCARCRAELENLLQLDQRLERVAERQPAMAAPQVRSTWPARRPAIAAAALAALAAAVVVVVLARRGPPGGDPWLMAEPERRVDVRLAYAPVDRHRPLASRTMGAGAGGGLRLPLEAMAALERKGDAAGLAAAYLLRNDRSLAEQAAAALAPLSATPEVEADRAAASIALGDTAAALRHADAALDRAPGLGPALWNRAVALQGLELRLAAAAAFERVAELGEPGWADEARRRAADLTAEGRSRFDRHLAVQRAGEALVASGTQPPPAMVADRPPVLRLFFYDAVRTRTSRAEVEALRPLAQALDRESGGDVLERYVARVAAADFKRRAPLAQAYAKLRQATTPQEREALLGPLLRSSEDDLVLGAMVQAGAVAAHLEEFEARAQATGDPWFQLLALSERAKAQAARGQEDDARRSLEDGLRRCAAAPIAYRCLAMEVQLADVDTQLARLEDAWEHAERALRLGRATNELSREDVVLGHLGQLSRLREDPSLARAYLQEAVLTEPRSADKERTTRTNLAMVALIALRFDEARAEIDRAIATGEPLGWVGAMALADIARQRPAPNDLQVVERAVAAGAGASPGQRAFLQHALARLLLSRDPLQGRARVEEALRAVEADRLFERDRNALRARTYGYTALILEEGRAGRYEAALELAGRELEGRLPDRCLVAVTEDSERTLVIVRGASGELFGNFHGDRTTPLPDDLTGLVPEAALRALGGCPEVAAFARPPLQGRVGLLPPDMAWSYRLRAQTPPAPTGSRAVHLVVKDVALAPERARELGTLNAWPASFGEAEEQQVLQGAEATPARVLAAMQGATEIDLVAHGVLHPGTDASYLVLAPEASGDELRAVQIREQRLEQAPLVVLAACRAARGTPSLHDASGLPAAFVRAGARGVLAATREIPDLEAARFFNAVRERVRQGASPAAALRDERVQWLSEQKGRTWLESVSLFQ